jgi:NADPH:quinone reductase-like Zn-dependent oxidoreductase
MYAILVHTLDGTRSFEVREVPTPLPRSDQLLVHVKATSINFADLSYGIGRKPKGDEPFIPGLDVAGVVESVGSEVVSWIEGDPVVALASRAAYAEFVLVRPSLAIPPPRNLRMSELASIPCVFLTAWYALSQYAKLLKDETVLIHSGGSGVGVAGIQVAKALGARVITTAGSDWKLEKAKALGAEVGINYSSQDLTVELQSLVGNHGIDVVLDPVGGRIFDDTLPVLACGGRVITVGGNAGDRRGIDEASIAAKDQSIQQIGMFNDAAADIEQHGWTQLKEWFENGTLRPVVDRILPWRQAEDAQRLLAERKVFGKVVLDLEA